MPTQVNTMPASPVEGGWQIGTSVVGQTFTAVGDLTSFSFMLYNFGPDDEGEDAFTVTISPVSVSGSAYTLGAPIWSSNGLMPDSGDISSAEFHTFTYNPNVDLVEGELYAFAITFPAAAYEVAIPTDWAQPHLYDDGGMFVWGQYENGRDSFFELNFADPYNVIDGTPGNDTLIGTSDDDQINGYDGHDYIRGNDGNDELNGGNGDDYLAGSGGDDTLNGDAGYDRVAYYNGAIAGVTVDLTQQGVAQNTGQGMDTLNGIEHASGTAYGDVLTGDGGDNWLWGSTSYDEDGVFTGANHDTLDGGDGNDLLAVGIGDHVLTGGGDTDTVRFTENGAPESSVTISLALQGAAQATGNGSWTLSGIENLSGGLADDTLSGDGNDNILAGDAGNDSLSGGAGNDTLYGDGYINVDTHGVGTSGPIVHIIDGGAGGNDTLEGGLGNDTLDGGAGIDTASYANASGGVNVNLNTGFASGADGNDTLANIENVIGSEFNDTLNGSAVGNNVIEGLGGNDNINGHAGDDTLYGGDGNDFLNGDLSENNITVAGNDIMYGGNGNDTLRGGLGDDELYGGDGNDNMRGNGGVDYFDGGADDGEGFNGIGDRISFFEQRATQGVIADLRTGIISNDGFGNVETMVGIESLGADTAYIDTLYGNDERNFLWASRGDYLYGFGGDDLFNLSAAGHVDGGLGTDLLSLPNLGFQLPDADSDGFAEQVPPMTSGWTVNLSAGTLLDGYGNAGTVTGIENVDGNNFADTITGDANANILNGGDGDDTLEGSGGDDTLDGGNGIDTASYANASGGVEVNLGGGFAFGADGNDTLANIENAVGSEFDDGLVGSSGDNVLLALGGNDTILGQQGNDTLDGGDGDDFAAGGQGSDTIFGGAGADSLQGNQGDDTLHGGDGNDSLVGGPGNDTLYGGDGHDFLRGDNADGLTPGNDYIDAGAGFDRVTYYNTNNGITVSLLLQGTAQDTGQGMDTLLNTEAISGSVFSDTFIGDDNDNWFFIGGAGVDHHTVTSDNISANGGNDLIILGLGNHIADGGSGTDTLGFAWALGEIFGGVNVSLAIQGAPQDTGQGTMDIAGFENLSGSKFDDVFVGDNGDNLLAGNAGSDHLQGGAGNDVLLGDGEVNMSPTNAGPPTVFDAQDYAAVDFFDSAGNPVFLFEGQDLYDADGNQLPRVELVDEFGDPYSQFTLNSVSYNMYVGFETGSDGVAGNDTLEGGLGDDTINGGGGSDTASYANASGSVQAFLYGGGYGEAYGADGYDQLHNVENLTGSAFNDQLGGDDGDNVIDGGDGHDGLRGWGGNDTLLGGGGDDFLNGGLGDDIIDGGSGYDRAAFYTDATAGVTVDLNQQGVAQDTGQGMDTLIGIENLSGTVFGDTLIGDGNDNVLWGSGSTISPGNIVTTNNDTLSGGGGNDLLWVGIGNHVVDGGSGTDTFRFNENGMPETGITLSLLLQGAAQASGNGNWTLTNIENLSGSLAGDSLTGDGNDNVLAGDAGDDMLSGGGGNDTLYGDGQINWDTHGAGGSGPIVTTPDAGAGGNDTLEGGNGNDQLFGGAGMDTASYASASGSVFAYLYGGGSGEAFGAAGYDQLDGIENLTGSAFNDQLEGDEGVNVLDGGDGHDGLRGWGGNDTLLGGNGDDFLSGGFGDDVIDGGTGFDRISHYNGAIAGVTVDLNLQGTAQDTGQGMDTLIGIEHVSGTLYGDTLIGDGNDNVLWGSASTISPGNIATTNNDTISGGGGNDLLWLGIGDHVVDGGSGTDTFQFTENGAPETGITLSLLMQGAAQASGNGSWTLTNIENLSGSSAGDSLTGDGSANVLAGDAGDDILSGGDGNDALYGDGEYGWDAHGGGGSGPIIFTADTGAAGSDTLEGGLGDDTLDGGGGIDTASYANAGGSVTVNLGGGFAFGADGNDTLANIENAIGSQFSDSLTGSDGGNVLEGLGGNDTLSGGAGDDMLHGGDGDDFLQGDLNENNITVAGNDVLHGGNGNDGLRGGLGDDQLYGGDGDDLLRGNGGVDYFDGGTDTGTETFNGIGDRVSFYERRATQGVVADLRTGIISNDGFGNVEAMVGIESLGADTAYVDTLHGDDNRNFLLGGLGDNLYGYGGDDIFQLSVAGAIVDGGDGVDRLVVTHFGGWLTPDTNADGLAELGAEATSGWTVNLGAGTLIDGHGHSGSVSGIENVDGSVLADTIIGDANANVLNGGDGDDTLDGGDGNDTLDGGEGNDTASFASASGGVQAQLYNGTFGEAFGAAGYDQLNNMENLTGSAHNDSLTGNNQDNILVGGDGHDFLRGNAGNDNLQGGNGDDYLSGGVGDDVLDGGDGWDRVSFFAGAIAGINVDLRIQGVAQATGIGNDTLIDIEHVSGTAFSDVMIGNGGANWIWGTSDADGGNDTLDGQGGDDVLQNGAGDHVISGGSGIDTFAYSVLNSTTGISLNLTLQGAAQNSGVGMMTLTGVENLSGSGFADTLIGDGGENVLAGGGGDDTLRGGAGNDTLYGDGAIGVDTHGIGASGPITTTADNGAGGNDLLEGGLGNDYIDGGGGIDTATYANASAGVNVNLGTGFASGADGNDTLVSIENAIGSEFNDSLNGSGGDNVLTGLGGNDVINGQGGNDTIYGGDGDDTLRGDAASELSLTVSGNDVIHGGNGNDNLRGGLGDDQMYGGANNDLLRGNNGVDYFDGGADDGDGANGIGDRISFFEQRATQGVFADLRTGIISNDGYGNVETMVGIESLGGDTAFADTFHGNDSRNLLLAGHGDYLFGHGGDDVIQTAGAAATVDGGSGTDTLFLVSGGGLLPDADADGLAEFSADMTTGWTVNLAAGTTLDGYGNSGGVTGIENVNGSTLGDSITGDANANVLNGGDGDDTLNGRAGDDTLDGGNGTDTASYGNASNWVSVDLRSGVASGGDGNDTLVSIENLVGSAFSDGLLGNDGDNVIAGGDGHDYMRSYAGNDTLLGEAGDDYLNGGAGDDTLDGGAGWDRVAYLGATAGVTVDLNIEGVAQNTGSQGFDTLIGIEQVSGTIFNDVLTGNGGDNRLWGGSDGSGVTGNDIINAGAGNDLVEVGAGTHTLSGGTGIDTLSLWGNGTDISAAGVTFSLASQGAAQNSEQGMMNAIGFENLSGSNHDDALTGDNNANILLGDLGNDTLRGNDGDDSLYGDGRMGVDSHGVGTSGAITLFGDAAALTSVAGGNDTLLGGRGDDYLYGGRGNDVMTGNQGIDRFVIEAASGTDRVTDFSDNIDKIVFKSSSGVDAFSDLTIVKAGTNVVITWGTSDSLTLDAIKVSQLTASDFDFII